MYAMILIKDYTESNPSLVLHNNELLIIFSLVCFFLITHAGLVKKKLMYLGMTKKITHF